MKIKEKNTTEIGETGRITRCIYLNLDSEAISFDREGLEVIEVAGPKQVLEMLRSGHFAGSCVLLGLSRNLMTNYLAITSILFSAEAAGLPVFFLIHGSHRIPECRGFLFGKKPYPVHRLAAPAIQELIELKDCNLRTFQRIPVEFVAFIKAAGLTEQVPVVCKNISWSGACFETREDLPVREFRLVLKSKLHIIELPCQLIRKSAVENPRRYSYGIRFLIPLPMSLIHYMYAKYRKDSGDLL